jgi:hypothetical protein
MERDPRESTTDHGVLSGATTDVEQAPNTSLPSRLEKTADEGTQPAKAVEEEYEYITGVKLYVLMASISLVYFLMMLDMSIIATVSFRGSRKIPLVLIYLTGCTSNH